MSVAQLTRRDQLGQKQFRFLVRELHCGEYGDCVTPFSLVYTTVVCTFLPDCTALRPRTAMIFHFFFCVCQFIVNRRVTTIGIYLPVYSLDNQAIDHMTDGKEWQAAGG
jgi:hypothetical protein